MAVTYDTAMKTARMNANKTYFASGSLEIQTAASAVIVTFPLTAAAGSVSGAVWTITPFSGSNTQAASLAGTNTANKAVIKNSGGTASITGLTVGTSGTDIILDNLSIAFGQNVTISSAAITHAA